jgi:hypothetical protein
MEAHGVGHVANHRGRDPVVHALLAGEEPVLRVALEVDDRILAALGRLLGSFGLKAATSFENSRQRIPASSFRPSMRSTRGRCTSHNQAVAAPPMTIVVANASRIDATVMVSFRSSRGRDYTSGSQRLEREERQQTGNKKPASPDRRGRGVCVEETGGLKCLAMPQGMVRA